MTPFDGKSLSFDVPDDWVDRSTTAYAAPSSAVSKTAANIVTSHDTLQGDEGPTMYVYRTIGELARRLSGFHLRDQRDTVMAGLPAKELAFEFVESHERIARRLTMAFDGSNVICATTSASTQDAFTVAPVFDAILRSMRLTSSHPQGTASFIQPTARAEGPSSAPPSETSSWDDSSAALTTTHVASPERGAATPHVSVTPSEPRTSPMATAEEPHGRPESPGDPSGRAKAAAAALWLRPVEELTARDLGQYLLWPCRHEITFVSDAEGRGVVVATGASEPLVFSDPTRLVELNTFLRNEGVAVPRGLLPNDLARSVRTLLHGPDGHLGSPGFFQRERGRSELWVDERGEHAELAFRRLCMGAVLNEKERGGAWTLSFTFFSRRHGSERWQVSGEGPRVKAAEFKVLSERRTA